MFKNHFGLIVSVVIALILSCCMASAAFIVDGMVFTIPALVKGWGTSFLVIVLTSIAIPTKMLGDKLALAFKLKINTLPFGLVSNIVPTLFYNTFATFVAVAVNVFCNEHIPAEAQFSIFLSTSLRDWLPMFGVSYILSLVAEKIAIKVAFKNVPPAVDLVNAKADTESA